MSKVNPYFSLVACSLACSSFAVLSVCTAAQFGGETDFLHYFNIYTSEYGLINFILPRLIQVWIHIYQVDLRIISFLTKILKLFRLIKILILV
jgi:hypothetical protein